VGSAIRSGTPRVSGFGERLRALRRARGLRQQDLAGGRYSAAYISMLEGGRTRASMKALEHIAERLGVAVSELLDGSSGATAADAALDVATALLEGGDPERGLEVLRALTSESLSPRQLIAKLRAEARAHIDLRRPKDALPLLDRALGLARQLDNFGQIARIRNQLGLACYYTFAYREAMQHHLAALEACQRGDVRDAGFEFRVLSHLGNDHTVLGEHAAAIGYYERALAISQDVVDRERLAGVHAGMAYAFTMRQDYEAAIHHARTSLTLYEQLGAERVVPEVMNTLAFLYGKLGNASRADQLLEKAIERAVQTGNRYAVPKALMSRAELYVDRDRDRAVQLAREALDAAVAAEQKKAILEARLFLASLQENIELGRAAFTDCLRFAEAEVNGQEREVLEKWSGWEEKHGDARRAAKLARQALALARSEPPA
jgi:tetratricopeptide (TPR) repeat protein